MRTKINKAPTVEDLGLYQKYRPKNLDQVVGQPEAVSLIRGMAKSGKFPHAIMFSGPSGTGKTTLARIVAGRYLGCEVGDIFGYHNVDCPTCEPTEKVREIKKQAGNSRSLGTNKNTVWVLNEFQSLSRAGNAQQGLLELTEEPPPNVYFIGCTTEPEKVIESLRTRFVSIRLKPVPRDAIQELLSSVAVAENRPLRNTVRDAIATSAAGSPRMALVLLENAWRVNDETAQLAVVSAGEGSAVGVDLARALHFGRGGWKEIADLLKKLDGENAEGIRRCVTAYARTVLLSDNVKARPRARAILSAFFDSVMYAGHPGLAYMADKVAGGK